MKMINKIAAAGLGLAMMGSSAFAQSLADAKKAIDAEQFQKAKSILKNLVTTEATKDENYFYLGWVYIKQDYPDSAKAVFMKGLNVNANSALNEVGLGIAAKLDKDQAGAAADFAKAITLAGKDSKPFVYIGKGYLLPDGTGKVSPADASAALDVLNKGVIASAVKSKDKTAPPASNDADLYSTRGEANRILLKSNEAYTDFSTAQTLDPKSPGVFVALGVLWKYADNFDGAADQFKQALALDPNYGPAYREWAETDLRQAQTVPTVAKVKVNEAAEYYKKYISLTDASAESQMRYADFLMNAGDYQTLVQVTSDLAKSSNANLRIYRYQLYAYFENKDFANAVAAGTTWLTKADPKRIIPRDYVYLGRAQIGAGQDSVGILNLRKALQLDSTETDLYGEIAKTLFTKDHKYAEASEAYKDLIAKGTKIKLTDRLYLGLSYYYTFLSQYGSKVKEIAAKADTSLLTKADSEFSYVAQKAAPNIPGDVMLYRARANDYKESDRNNIKGLAKPYYEKYVDIIVAKGAPDDATKTKLLEAYDYLGAYYEFKEKDDAKAGDYYGKARDLDPTNKGALDYFKRKGGAKSK